MPIKVQSDLPARDILENENIFVMDEYRALHQDMRSLQICILNLMPVKQDTELHLLRSLSNTPLQVDVTFMKMNSHISLNTSITHLNQFYHPFDELKENKYDVVHLHMCNSAAMMYGRIAKQAGVLVVVYHSHNTNLSTNHRLIKTMVHTLSKYRFEKYGDVYFSCSDLASKWMFTKRSVRENKVQVINNGIDLERFAFDPVGREKCRGILGIGNKTLIGHIGRFGVAKNHPFLIDVFDDYHKVNPESVLLLIGEGDYEQIIRDKVHALGLDDSVIFYGTTKEIPQMLWAMDVFVLPSLFEGNPVVGIEAQAASVPCIFADTITRMCQLTENVSYLSLEAPYEQWSDEISRMSQLERKNTTSEMRSAGYDIKMVAKEVQAVYETVLKQKKK